MARDEITEACQSCIASQFARRVPIAQQEACGELCLDADGDGFGFPGAATCRFFEEDCNDANPNVNPKQPEQCGDAIDNNCDGIRDGKNAAGNSVPEIPDGLDDNCDGGAEPEIASGCATHEWLCRRGEGDDAKAQAYYQAIAAPADFEQWRTLFGFGPGTEANRIRAFYYNDFDLRLGREMNCTRNSPTSPASWQVACYVTNYGRLGPGSPPEGALHDAILGDNPVASVAMVYDPGAGAAEDVQFYVYGINTNEENFTLQKQVPLDSEGNKAAPELCLPCHGGRRSIGDKANGANFLPFDLDAFDYSSEPGFARADQEEAFRMLNELVKTTSPAGAITELIDGWYGQNVGVPGTQFDGSFVPAGWKTAFTPPEQDPQGLYRTIVQPYCRGCHVALDTFPFDTYTRFPRGLVALDVCTSYPMPHAEVPLARFWTDASAAPFLASFVGPGWPSIGTCVVTDPP